MLRKVILVNRCSLNPGSFLSRRVSNFSQEQAHLMNDILQNSDPVISELIDKEKDRQRSSINLIPSENYASKAVMQALGSILQNKYSEGYPGARYYAGNEFVDKIETICQNRALELFGLDKEKWGVNVQALSGSPANLYVYYSALKLHDRIMNLDLSHGGHLSHGYRLKNKKVSAISSYYETFPYFTDLKTGFIDYDNLALSAQIYRPNLIVAGSSAYPRVFDYKRIREIADNNNSYLLADIAHVSGLVAAKLIPTPFEYCDLVTTTTHKSLRGPRGALIFYRKGVRSYKKQGEILYNFQKTLNSSVFPGHQGGPHNHTIGALAVALRLAQTQTAINYQKQVLKNSKFLANELMNHGLKLVSGGTDLHMMLIDLKHIGSNVNGGQLEHVLDSMNITVNKNTIPGDTNAFNPNGIRIGTPAMTTRGFEEREFKEVANWVGQAIVIVKKINSESQPKNLNEFKVAAKTKESEILKLKNEVSSLAESFPMIGI